MGIELQSVLIRLSHRKKEEEVKMEEKEREEEEKVERDLLELLVKMECERAIEYWFSPRKLWQRLHGLPVKPRIILDPDPALLGKYISEHVHDMLSLPPAPHDFEEED
ncbi:MAG: hypothetical protein QXQ64_09980 [Candidatus Bathyarchaeia archaeon]